MSLDASVLPNELKLLLALVGSRAVTEPQQPPEQLANKNIDWKLVIEFAQHHRLIPLFFASLKNNRPDLAPEHNLIQLKKLHEHVVRQNLAHTTELKRIIPALNKEDIDVSILKGRALAEYLYGDIALRQSRDIDLLVRAEDVVKADSVLQSLGFKVANSPDDVSNHFKVNSALGEKFIHGRQELDYFSTSRNTYIDLHWHLSHSYHAFPISMNDLWPQMKSVENDCGIVYELPLSLHFVFLCYHGAKHHWLRLHWLLDIAILIHKKELDWNTIIDTAKQYGVLPTVKLAIMLANKFFNSPVPEQIKSSPRQFKNSLKLSESFYKDIILPPAEVNTNVMPFMDFKRIKSGYRLQTKFPHRFLTWTDLIYPSDTDYQSVRLPASLSLLYFFVRFFNLCSKLLDRVKSKIFFTKKINQKHLTNES